MKHFFFDLDGTLTDAREGLHTSFRAALDALGLPRPNDRSLDRFLGTPLPEMFRSLKAGVTKKEIAAGIEAFRAAYEAQGIFQNRLYPGVREMLDSLMQRGYRAGVVTSKPEHYARRVVRDLGIDQYLKVVVGAGLDELDTKTGLLARALADARAPMADSIMLGDRSYDIVGALENGVVPVGALWGYGSREELKGAGCRLFAESVAQFRAKYVEAGSGSPRANKRPRRILGTS